MNEKFLKEFEILISNYTEMLIGTEEEEMKEKVKIWMLYTFMAKNMPGLVKHWNEKFPDSKLEIVKWIKDIKQLNEKEKQHRGKHI